MLAFVILAAFQTYNGHSSPVVDDSIDTYRALFGRLDVGSPREQLTARRSVR